MIKRFVKMTFESSRIQDFIKLFESQKDRILAVEGCEYLELLQDMDNEGVFFTFSIWKDPIYLEKYRESELFKGIWANTKPLFADKPEAWSVKGL